MFALKQSIYLDRHVGWVLCKQGGNQKWLDAVQTLKKGRERLQLCKAGKGGDGGAKWNTS